VTTNGLFEDGAKAEALPIMAWQSSKPATPYCPADKELSFTVYTVAAVRIAEACIEEYITRMERAAICCAGTI
jgi:hypothetical protein